MAPKGVALLGAMALLGWVWPCWSKPNSVQVGFEDSYMFMLCPVSQITYYCLLVNIQDSQLLLQHCVCLDTTMLHHDDKMV